MAESLPHPTAIGRPKNEIQRDFISIEQTRCSDPIWHFRVGLPHACAIGPQGEEPPGDDEPRTLGLFHRENPPADIEVTGVMALREVDPADYLDCLLEVEQKNVVSRKSVPMRGGVVGDAVATWKAEGDKTFAGRYFCTKWGPRIFVLEFRTPKEHYEQLAEDFFVSIATFSVLDDSLGLFAEKVHTVSNTAPIPWRVVVPESWIIKPEPNTDKVASFQATQVPVVPSAEGERLYGKLSFAVVARSEAKTGRAAANAYLSAVRDLGIAVETDAFVEEPAADPFEKSWLLVSNVTKQDKNKNKNPGELRCRVLMHKKAWVIAGVLGPVRKDSALAWMQNKRVLDIVTTTLKLKS